MKGSTQNPLWEVLQRILQWCSGFTYNPYWGFNAEPFLLLRVSSHTGSSTENPFIFQGFHLEPTQGVPLRTLVYFKGFIWKPHRDLFIRVSPITLLSSNGYMKNHIVFYRSGKNIEYHILYIVFTHHCWHWENIQTIFNENFLFKNLRTMMDKEGRLSEEKPTEQERLCRSQGEQDKSEHRTSGISNMTDTSQAHQAVLSRWSHIISSHGDIERDSCCHTLHVVWVHSLVEITCDSL